MLNSPPESSQGDISLLDPRVEVVIACHSDARPLGRAVASVLEGNGAVADVTVIAHGIDPDRLAATLRPEHRERTRMLRFDDGIPSPSGPFTYGIAQARHPWVSIMGSDDFLMPGTVDSWLQIAARTGADVVVTRLSRGTPSRVVPTPPARFRRRDCIADFRKDRLVYRSAPLGLIRKSLIGELELTFNPGFAVGEDVIFTTRLFAEARVAIDRWGPSYVIGEDASDRVTYVIRPMADQLAFVRPTCESEWFNALPPSVRREIAVKFLRIHVFGAVHYRPETHHWLDGDRSELSTLTRLLLDSAPRTLNVLSRAEAALIKGCLEPALPASELARLSRSRRAHGKPSTLITSDPLYALHRIAPLRFMAASAFVSMSSRVHPPRSR